MNEDLGAWAEAAKQMDTRTHQRGSDLPRHRPGMRTGIKRADVLIQGFTQSVERESGMEILWRQMRIQSTADRTVLPPLNWNSAWRAWANFLSRIQNGKRLDVRIYAYSWGCGWGFWALATELRKRGIDVTHAVLADPVYHSCVRPWRAMWFSRPIYIPSNVYEVDWFYQRYNRPWATTLRATNELTRINLGRQLYCNHEYMDDQTEFHDKCLDVSNLPYKVDSRVSDCVRAKNKGKRGSYAQSTGEESSGGNPDPRDGGRGNCRQDAVDQPATEEGVDN